MNTIGQPIPPIVYENWLPQNEMIPHGCANKSTNTNIKLHYLIFFSKPELFKQALTEDIYTANNDSPLRIYYLEYTTSYKYTCFIYWRIFRLMKFPYCKYTVDNGSETFAISLDRK